MSDFPEDEVPTKPTLADAFSPAARRAVLDRIAVAWDHSPGCRLGQLIVTAVGALSDMRSDGLSFDHRDRECLNLLFMMHDSQFAETLEKWGY